MMAALSCGKTEDGKRVGRTARDEEPEVRAIQGKVHKFIRCNRTRCIVSTNLSACHLQHVA